ncbi:hypothetical protein [Tautonia plasticadhaerens]|nr:hypothetical protein [Tautonia plasticadhaerens]
MPRHWDERAADGSRVELGLPSGDLVRDWAIGQLATLRAGLEVLSGRVSGPPDGPDASPWPEFSEYSCDSCHHSLLDEGLRNFRGDEIPGTPAWASWSLPMSRALVGQTELRLIGPVDAVDRLMREPYPDRDRVAEQAERLARSVGGRLSALEGSEYDRDDLRDLIASLAEDPGQLDGIISNRDGAAQFFLACRALAGSEADALLRAGRPRPGDVTRLQGVFQAIREVGDALEFPEETHIGPGSREEPSPRSDRAGPILEAFDGLMDRLLEAEDGLEGGENVPIENRGRPR